MRKITVFSVLVLLFTSLISCQREVGDGNDEVIQADQQYLAKLVETDTTYPPGSDTLFITTYSYDAAKRLVRRDETIFTAGTHTVEGTISVRRYYNGTDTLPYKLTSEELYTNGEYYTDTMFLFYNAGHVIIKDSLLVYNASSILAKNRMTLFPAGANRYYIREDYFNPATSGTVWSSDSVYSGFTVSGDNLVSCYDSVYSLPPGSLNYTVQNNYTYDNKQNPFRKMALPYLANSGYASLGIESSRPYLVSLNNLAGYTIASWTTGGGSTHTAQVLYEYTAEGYPKIARFSSLTDPSKGKNYYFYITL